MQNIVTMQRLELIFVVIVVTVTSYASSEIVSEKQNVAANDWDAMKSRLDKMENQNIELKDRLSAAEVIISGMSAFNSASERQDDFLGNNAEVRTKRDTSGNPNAAYYEQQQHHHKNQAKDSNYAAYYEQYPEQYQLNNIQQQETHEKVGFGVGSNAVDKQGVGDLLGPDTALMLGLLGAVLGAIGTVGVVLNNNNINELSKDQDSICTAATGLGGTTFATADTGLSVTNFIPVYNVVIGQLNAIATPDCT